MRPGRHGIYLRGDAEGVRSAKNLPWANVAPLPLIGADEYVCPAAVRPKRSQSAYSNPFPDGAKTLDSSGEP